MADGSKIVDSGKPQWTQATPAGYMPGFGNDFETAFKKLTDVFSPFRT